MNPPGELNEYFVEGTIWYQCKNGYQGQRCITTHIAACSMHEAASTALWACWSTYGDNWTVARWLEQPVTAIVDR